MNCIFGPVNSRRLGRSLGIDLFPSKICNLNCIYCEVGRTASLVGERGDYSDIQAIAAEIDAVCADAERMASVDVLTVTAKGEPTLHSGLGAILRHIKQRTEKPVAVLTNGTTLADVAVRLDLLAADLVVPSLDAARAETFQLVDRPGAGFDLAGAIEGLKIFSHQFAGKLWLEILMVQGLNDGPEDVDALIAALRPMRIDRIQLNTVVRPPAERFALPTDRERLAEIGRIFENALGVPVDLPFVPAAENAAVVDEAGRAGARAADEAVVQKILQMLQRRPCTAADIDRTFHLGGPDKIEQLLEPLICSGLLQLQEHGDLRFYQHSS
jgi:wyosine [tRNA(Phe)-imidazoG37] synthetase (radical SAM superfamily)